MRPVKVLCLEDEPTGLFHGWGTRDGDTVAIVELDDGGEIICANPEAIRFIDVRRTSM